MSDDLKWAETLGKSANQVNRVIERLRAREAVLVEALNQAHAIFRTADHAEIYTVDDMATDFVKVRKIVVESVATLDVEEKM